jgi:hypothetical protein
VQGEKYGYLQVMVASESDVDVFFDDLNVTHTGPLVVQENYYFPFVLNMGEIEQQGQPDDKFQYNSRKPGGVWI